MIGVAVDPLQYGVDGFDEAPSIPFHVKWICGTKMADWIRLSLNQLDE
ncbi:MAG TPA: hypothetical protein VIH27_04060 [Nitrososphaerales archaeon]